MEAFILSTVEAITEAYRTAGIWAALATLLIFSVRLYRLPVIQDSVPVKLRWASWPLWARYLVPFGLAFAGALIIALLAGTVTTGAAIAGALSAGIAAIGGHKGTKALGRIEGSMKSLDYTPGPVRKAAGFVVPIDKKFLPPEVKSGLGNG